MLINPNQTQQCIYTVSTNPNNKEIKSVTCHVPAKYIHENTDQSRCQLCKIYIMQRTYLRRQI
jgi:hypothetical protein